MKKTAILAIFIICSIQLSSYCQDIMPAQLKNGRNAAYGWISDYNTYANCDGNSSTNQFISLFKSDTLKIFNDYYPMNSYDFQKPKISLSDYVSLLRDEYGFYHMRYTIHDARIVKEFYENGLIFFNVIFLKEVSFFQKNNYQNDRYEYPVRNLNIEVILEYNISENKMFATSLECHDIVEPFVLVHEGNSCSYTKKNILLHKCAINSTPLLKQSICSIPEDDKMYEFEIDTVKHYIGFGYGISHEYVDAPIRDTRFSEYDISDGRQNEVMFNYYQQLSFVNRIRFGIEVGLSYHWSTIIAHCNYHEQYDDVDPDGSPYSRIIESSNYQESILQKVISVPITAKYEYFLNDQISLFGQAGVNVSFNMMNSSAQGHLFYKGYYDWLYNLVIDQNGIYDFGEYDIRNATDPRRTNFFSLGVESSFGGCYYFSDKWMIQAAIRYRIGLWNDSQKESVYNLSKYNGAWMPLVNVQESYRLSDISFILQLNYNL